MLVAAALGSDARADATGGDAAHASPLQRVVIMRAGAAPARLPGVIAVKRLRGALNAYLVTTHPDALAGLWSERGVIAVQPNSSIRRSVETAACVAPPAAPDYLLQAVDASSVSLPGSTPPIAILDGGLDAGQPQFSGRIVDATDVVTPGSDASDSDGHGTAVASVAAAAGATTQGVSPTSPIMPIKIFGPDGTATAADVVAGIGVAMQDHAGVINLSGASPLAGVAPSDDQAVRVAIDMAFSRGIVVVAASGNEGASAPDVPASDPHVISVGAIGESGRLATFSNHGLTLDLVAPGVQLTEPAPSSVCATGFEIVDGTSFAAPAVSGAAALLEALRPSLSVTQRFDAIRTSARALSVPGWNPFTGFGALDVAAMLKAQTPPADPDEVNDDVYWITGPRARDHPALVDARHRRGSITATIERNKDPNDVYRLVLTRGEHVTASIATSAGVLVQLAFWGPKTGPFEISSGKHRHRLAWRPISVQGSLSVTAKRAGTYFVSVTAAHTLSGGSPYTLTLRGR